MPEPFILRCTARFRNACLLGTGHAALTALLWNFSYIADPAPDGEGRMVAEWERSGNPIALAENEARPGVVL